MTKLRDSLLPVFDTVARGIPNILGLRQYDVSLRIVGWSGARPGLGTKTVYTYPITVNQNKADNNRPKVVLISTREIIASGGKYVDGDYRIGPLTPQYTDINGHTFGTLPSDIEQAVQNNPQEIFFNMRGPGMSDETGDWFKLVEANFSRNFGYTIVIRKTGQTP